MKRCECGELWYRHGVSINRQGIETYRYVCKACRKSISVRDGKIVTGMKSDWRMSEDEREEGLEREEMNETEVIALHSKITDALVPIAVFVDRGRVRKCKVTTDLYRDAMRRCPERLMGIYNSDCHLEWLKDDLAFCGMALG